MKGLLTTIALLLLTTTALAQDPPAASASPIIRGNVFGGGRMANVSNTATQTVEDANKVTATIDIYASTINGGVFGGNDITGAVKQATGDDNASAKITVYDHCDGTCSVKEVYGGGNGYYKYKIGDNTIEIGNITDENKSTAVNANTLVEVLDGNGTKVAEFYTSEATTYGGLLPSLGNTSVIVGEATDAKNHVALAEVYGGAKNAYVTGTSSVTVNSGTIGKVFAGNNYGGNAQSAILTINGTKKPTDEPTADNFATFDWAKVGDYNDTENGFGIGEAYGGGNAVDVNSRALVYMNDGYVGTLFGGNNLADMSAVPTVHLNGGNLQTVYGGGNAGAMKGCQPAQLDISAYLNDDLFAAYGDKLHAVCSSDAYLYFYGAETLVEEKNVAKPLMIKTVYGGCRAANVDMSTYVRVTKPSYVGTVYGGCDIAGSVGKGGATTTTKAMSIEYYDATDANDPAHATSTEKVLPQGFPIINLASHITITDGTISGDCFGGGNGDYIYETTDNTTKAYAINDDGSKGDEMATFDNTKTDMPWVKNSIAAMEGGLVTGNIYGGGNNATVGTSETPGRAYVLIGKTKRGVLGKDAADTPYTGPVCTGTIYAGGKKADVYGTVDLLVKAGARVTTLYAGNDISGEVKGTNRAVYANTTSGVSITTPLIGGSNTYNGTPLNNVNNATADADKQKVQAYVRVEGAGNDCDDVARSAAYIGTLFGGGNGDYTYSEPTDGYVSVTSTDGSESYGKVLAASATLAKPVQQSCWLDIKGEIGTSYGGGNAAEVSNSNTYITGDAVVGTAFAGGNSATVTIVANLWLDCDGTRGTQAYVDGSNNTNIPNVGTIFGGNNLADMNIVPKVQLWRGSVQTVYGGGNQGSMKGVRPYMVDLKEYVSGNWFNGNYPLYSSDKVICFKGTNLIVDSPYEKNDDHTPTANPCGLVIGDVYAGCRAANVDNSSYVRVSHCDYINNIYGGCDIAGSVGMYPGYFASNSPYRETAEGENKGKVKFYHLDSNYAVQEVYKEVPENAPMVNPTSCVLFTGGTVSGNIYGSGNGAYNYVEDGNTVKVYRYGETQDEAHLQASYDKTKMTKPFSTVTTVQIAGGTVEGNVYGGGNMAEVGRIVTAEDVTMHTSAGYTSSTIEGKDAYHLFPSWTTTILNQSTTFPEHYVKVGDEISAISNVFLGKSEAGRSDVVINGNVYGGGRMADVHGAMDILALKDVTINSLFAGNDIAGSVLGTSRVSRFTPNTDYTTLIGDESTEGRKAILNTSFSGVTLTAANANTYVRIMPDAKITNLYGGGNGYYFYEQNSDKVKIYSLNEDKSKGSTYYGEVTAASVEDAKPVQQSTFLDVAGNVTTSYGGGNAANIGTSNLWIVKDAQVGTAFAGGNAATVTKAANLYLDCDGTRSTLDYLNGTDGKIPNVGTIFGGNNIADMNIVPWMELHRGSVKTVYGGGNKGNMCGHDALFVDGSKIINPSLFTGSYPTFAADKVLLFAATDVMIDSKYGKDASGNDVPDDGLVVGDVYGGCKQANVNNSSYMRITHAQYIGNVYGGCDISGSVGFNPGTLTEDMLKDGKLQVFSTNGVNGTEGVSVDNSFVGKPLYNASTFVYMTGGTVSGNVYGGGNGNYGTIANGKYNDGDYIDVAAPFVAATTVNIEKGTIKGNLYGGGNKADVGYVYQEAGSYFGKNYAAGDMLTNMSYIYMGNGADETSVNVEGSVYGGCKNANVYGAIDILALKDVNINNLFAGNDISGSIKGNWRGTRFSLETNNMTSLIGTGTDDASRAKDKLSFSGETLTGENANVYVRVMQGAKIINLYGGGNGEYDYTSGTYSGLTSPAMHSTVLDVAGNVSTVYGGGNAANIDNTNVCIYGPAVVGTSEVAGAVYGGCKSADVTHVTNVLMMGNGTVSPTVNGNVFGGCDVSGNVGDCTLACNNADGTKNNDAHLSDATEPTDATVADYSFVKIIAGKVTNRVFGGGNGLQSADGTAYYTGTPVCTGTAPFDVFTYPEGSTYAGKQLPVCQNTYVLVKNATIGTNESTSGNEVHTCFGGGQGAGTKVMHNAYTALGTSSDQDNSLINGILYGGSYAGFVNSTCVDVTRTTLLGYGNTTSVKGDIYGGSYGNYVRGNIDLNINNISIGATNSTSASIYAGNNSAGQPECNACINYTGNDCKVVLYGGGNHADFYGTTRITFTTGDIGYIYGGGNNADVYGNTIVEVLGGHVCHDVFGGGNNGNVKVWNNSTEHPTPDGTNYGGNTLVIVRDDCLLLGADANSKNPGEDGYVPTFATVAGNRQANRGTTSYFNTNEDGTEMTTKVDPYTSDKQMYVLKPNGDTPETCKKNTIEIEGNVFGGGNAADVEGKATVIIGNK